MGRKPNLATRLAIDALHKRSYSEAQIAKALGLTPADCRAVLADARTILESSAVSLAADYLNASATAARKGDHRPARDMLDRLKVTEPVGASDTTPPFGIKVEITAGFALPGIPNVARPPAIDVSATAGPSHAAAAPPLLIESQPDALAAQPDEARRAQNAARNEDGITATVPRGHDAE